MDFAPETHWPPTSQGQFTYNSTEPYEADPCKREGHGYVQLQREDGSYDPVWLFCTKCGRSMKRR